MSRRLLIALVLAALAPAPAAAADATIVKRDVPLQGGRSLAASAPARFDLVGLHWRGAGSVEFRTRSLAGRWSAWQPAAPEREDLPDARSPERARAGGWRLGNPWWVGPSNRIQYRTRGRVSALRAWFVSSPEERVPLRATAAAAATAAPKIVPRSAWRADESIRRGQPTYATQLRFAVVHHTAGANGYTAAQSASIVRAIQLYHVRGNGWNDIGYNFLVDKYGTVFEGRYGGIDRNVVGAHAEGFNTGSVGVAVLGEYTNAAVTGAAADAVSALLAWRLDLAHVDPLSTVNAISGGNARFPSGIPVFLRAVSGHRDTGFTECPGNALYALLNSVGGRAQAIGLPKLYAPTVAGGVGGKIRFRARVSGPVPWTVTVLDAVGMPVASGSGTGPALDWTWDATLAPVASYRWQMTAGDAVPASGTLGPVTVTPPTVALAITGVAADPETISPNEDGTADAATLTYTLNGPAAVTIRANDLVGAPVATLWTGRRAAGEHVYRFTAAGLADGRYQLQVIAKGTDGIEISQAAYVVVTRTLGFVESTRPVFSPNADGRVDRIRFTFLLGAPARVRMRVLRDGKWVATPFDETLQAGRRRIEWDGAKRVGRLLDGSYEAVLEATDAVGTSAVRVPFASDTRAPRVKILSGFPLRVWVSEPADLTLRAGGASFRERATEAGDVVVAGAPPGRVRVVAWDAAGNKSAPVVRR